MAEEGSKPRHIGDPRAAAQADLRPRVLVSRCLLGHRVRYDGRDKHQSALDPLLGGWRVVGVCPELAAGLGVPRPPMDLVGPPGAARPVERASGRDLSAAMAPTVARLVTDFGEGGGLDGAILKARSPSCGIGSAARYDAVDDVDPAARVDGVFAAAVRGLAPPPRLIDEVGLADADRRARFAIAVHLRAQVRHAADAAALARLYDAWTRTPLGTALEAIGLHRRGWIALKDDRACLVGHIDRAVDRLPATFGSGVHLMIGS